MQSEDEIATLDASIDKKDRILDEKNRVIKGLKFEVKILKVRNRELEDQASRSNNEMRDRFNTEKLSDLEDQRMKLQTQHQGDTQ